ncbi:MAG: tetratricopeptide repeat protein [Leptospiraceae bacterium]|nr:tetratricopeptide repeat protein [Leptospiraceae bacterium]MDW8305501.1 tetratricopeptide repeat protein [Leptospiraceae bacterium]
MWRHWRFFYVVELSFMPLWAESSDELNRAGIKLSGQGRFQEAAERFKEAIALDEKKSGLSWHNLGYTYELMGKKEEAKKCYEAAIERNPSILESRVNLGRLAYEMGLYAEAVRHGEAALQLDPNNAEVQRYLPLAREQLKKQGEKAPVIVEDKVLPGEEVFYEVGSSALFAFSYNKENDAFALYRQAGFATIPYDLHAELRVRRRFGFSLEIKNPYLGILTPGFLAGQQNLEYYYIFGNFYAGVGALFTQLDLAKDSGYGVPSFIANREYRHVVDGKFGLVLGWLGEQDKSLLLRVYPRYLFRDPQVNPKINEFDFVRMELLLRKRFHLFSSDSAAIATRGQDFFLNARLDEIYITEYRYNNAGQLQGHYFGSYLLEAGMEFTTASPIHRWGVSFGERLYFWDLADGSPFAFGNGQGYFGFDTELALQGNAFPGFRGNSHVVQIFFRQFLGARIRLKEILGVEITNPAQSVHSFFVQLGLSSRL